MGINTGNLNNISGVEIMRYTLLWVMNWNKEDFQIAFKDSSIGWEYQWNKLQGKMAKDENGKGGMNSTQAIVEVILNMDEEHENLLFDFIFNVRYPGEIKGARRSRESMKRVLERIKAEEENGDG